MSQLYHKPTEAYLAAYGKALKGGAITLMAATWQSPENEWIEKLLKAAGKQ